MSQTLYAVVCTLADGSPYVVTPTGRGFDVHVDLADARWYGLFERHGLRVAYAHVVVVDEAERWFTVTDISRTLEWEAGASLSARRPVLRAASERRVGRIREVGVRKEWGWDDKLRFGKVLDYTLDTEESRSLIRTAAARLGYKERRPPSVKFAAAAAALGGVIAVLTLVLLCVAAASGRL